MRRTARLPGLALIAATLFGSTASAQERATRFAVKATILMPGEAYVAEIDRFFDIDMSFGAGVTVESRLGEKLVGGLYLDLLQARAYDESAMMVDMGLALMAALGGGADKVTWRPGLAVGYGTLAAVGDISATHYLTLRGGLEALHPAGWLVEASLFGAPSGGNDEATVTYGPMMMLRVGRLF
jgi:hypothetical protein